MLQVKHGRDGAPGELGLHAAQRAFPADVRMVVAVCIHRSMRQGPKPTLGSRSKLLPHAARGRDRPPRAECLHGVWDLFGDAGNAPTVFPAPIALAAAFDAPLLARVAGAIADETRAKANIYLARENKVRWALPAARARRRRASAGAKYPASRCGPAASAVRVRLANALLLTCAGC